MLTRCIAVASVVAIVAVLPGDASAQDHFKVLHAFPNPGGVLQVAPLVLATDGDFYGSTYEGGDADLGTIFKITAGGALTVLHSFTGGTDGASPYAALIQAADGNFYGTTLGGGTSDLGTIFKMTPAGTVTVLHQFAGGSDGSFPYSPLVQAPDGNFYGTTAYGGDFGRGTTFKTTPTGVVTILNAIQGLPYETHPFAGLIHATDGNFYGVSSFGGGFGNRGALFRMAPAGSIVLVHVFSGAWDGEYPYAEVVQGADGNLYGTTSSGGPFGMGVAFKSTLDGAFTVLHEFTGGADGGQPSGQLRQGPDGNFYGTTASGGASSLGVVYRMTPAGIVTPIHAFAGADGSCPCGAVVSAADASFFGRTYGGGAFSAGTIFQVTSDGGFTVVRSFTGDPEDAHPSVIRGFAHPRAPVILGTDGNLYGTTLVGGTTDLGAVFKIDLNGTVTLLHSFSGNGDGGQPSTALVQAADGNFYGGTGLLRYGGTASGNVLFTITPAGTFTALHVLDVTSEGQLPSTLIQATDGNLYGTTQFGGSADLGTVFKMTPAGALTTLHVFTGGADGAGSVASLVQATDGNFYGTTAWGGAWGFGTVFKMTPAGVVTILHAFAGGSDGSFPNAPVIQGRDGNLYGTTTRGGARDSGTVFKTSLTGSAFTVLHSFTPSSGDGAVPSAPLLQTPDGAFYGTTTYGGPSGMGTIFKMTPTGTAIILHGFNKMDGARPFGGLVRTPDGNFFGTTYDGGPSGMGVVFQSERTLMPLFWRNRLTGQNVGWLMNGTTIDDVGVPPAIGDTNWEVKAQGDFNADGDRDVVWRHKVTGQNIGWLMLGTAIKQFGFLPTIADTNWEIKGVGDFNADGRADIIWRHKVTGQNIGWLMNGLTVSSSAFLPTIADTNWEIQGVGDFNRDGKADVIWRHKVAGQNIVWFMNDLAVGLANFLPTIVDMSWAIAGVGDLDADGKADVIWRNTVTGQNVGWLMDGAIVAWSAFLPAIADVNWEVTFVGDLDANGTADMFWRHKVTGQNVVWLMNGLTVSNAAFLPTIADANWEIVGP